MFFKVINYNWYKNPQKKRCEERWKKLKKNKPDEVWRVQVRGVRGLYLVPQMVHTYTENVKCHHDISLNSKALSETHKPFLSFVFQKLSKKKKPPWFTLTLTKMFYAKNCSHSWNTWRIIATTHLFIYQKQLVCDGFPFHSLLVPVYQSHCAVQGNDLLIWGREKSCAERSQATCLLSALIWSASHWSKAVSSLKQNSASYAWTGLSQYFQSFITSDYNHFRCKETAFFFSGDVLTWLGVALQQGVKKASKHLCFKYLCNLRNLFSCSCFLEGNYWRFLEKHYFIVCKLAASAMDL